MTDAEAIIDELAAHRAELCGGPGRCDFCRAELRDEPDEEWPPVELGGES